MKRNDNFCIMGVIIVNKMLIDFEIFKDTTVQKVFHVFTSVYYCEGVVCLSMSRNAEREGP